VLEDPRLLEWYAVSFGSVLLILRRIVVSSPWASSHTVLWLLEPEDEGTVTPQDVSDYHTMTQHNILQGLNFQQGCFKNFTSTTVSTVFRFTVSQCIRNYTRWCSGYYVLKWSWVLILENGYPNKNSKDEVKFLYYFSAETLQLFKSSWKYYILCPFL
jgi:hypothetical protein